MENMLSGLESSHAAIVLIVYVLGREFFLFLRSKKEGHDPVTRLHNEVLYIKKEVEKTVKQTHGIAAYRKELEDIARYLRVLMEMHLDSDSKFSTVHLTTKVEDSERRIVDILQRIELATRP